MGRRSSTVEHNPDKLSYEEMKAAITKIDRRLDEIKAFDIQTIWQGSEPTLQVLSGKLQQLLIDTFGNSTHEYFQYASYTELRVMIPTVMNNKDLWNGSLVRSLAFAILAHTKSLKMILK